MRIRTPRSIGRLAALTLLLAGLAASAGCDGQQGGDEAKKLDERARQVAEAWDGSVAAAQWRAGYHPMGAVVQLPQGGLRGQSDKRAYESRGFLLKGELPTTRPDGQVAWAEGETLQRPVLTADTAYKTIARADSEGPHLTVTEVKLGEMTLATSRGPAAVPAWHFALDGYDTPLKRSAVRPSELPKSPIRKARDLPGHPVRHLTDIDQNGRSVTVMTLHGACDDGSTVPTQETRESVVLSASVMHPKRDNANCNKRGELQRVTVQLDRPLNDRVLLDAHTGQPIPYKPKFGPSPSWG